MANKEANTESSPSYAHWHASIGIVFCVTALVIFSLITLFSAESSIAITQQYFNKQLLFLGVSVAAACIVFKLDLEKLRPLWPILAIGLIGALVVVLLIGAKVNGAKRWIDLGFFKLQPSEFCKIGIVFVLAHYFAKYQRYMNEFWRGIIIPCLIFGIPFGLILLEPDFGTAILCAGVSVTLMFIAGVSLFWLGSFAAAGVAGISCLVYLDPVRIKRVTSFLNPEQHRVDDGYQLWQSLLAFGSGGTDGVGLGQSRQFSFLPEAHTDFVFAIIGEEMGYPFAAAVALLFVFFFIFGIVGLRQVKDSFLFYLALGGILMVSFQAFINMGVVMGLLPTKGISLPFVSYGGSNLLTMFILVGLILNAFFTGAKKQRAKTVEV